MRLPELLNLLRQAPLVASVQASEGSPVGDPATLLHLAQASLAQGVRLLRLEGVEAIGTIKPVTCAPVIGLIKRKYPDSEVYITPTVKEVDALLDLGCEIIALDATLRPRPNGTTLSELAQRVKSAGRLLMADCDGVESVLLARELGFDLVGTTLRGYTGSSPSTPGPDLAFLRQAVAAFGGTVLAEGRYEEPWHAHAARAVGAAGVVVGGALNDPVKQTRRFLQAMPDPEARIGAVDIGGTWLRFGVVCNGEITDLARIELPASRENRLAWIRDQLSRHPVTRVGVSTGGVVEPATGVVTESKPIIPNHVGSEFSARTLGVPTRALNDGLATAWGHACLPDFAGLRVATLALGTGVGAGCVDRGRLLVGKGGDYPRLNDLPATASRSFEDLLGGAALSAQPSAPAKAAAREAAEAAYHLIQALWMPDVVVVCGGVGLADWLDLPGTVRSPYGPDAGLIGAAHVAQWVGI